MARVFPVVPSAARPAFSRFNRCVGGWFGSSQWSAIRLIDEALVFEGTRGQLE
jgi:hypothetical protein